MSYRIRFIHKISPRDTDTIPAVDLPDGAFADRNTLGAALRQVGALCKGERVREFRTEGARVIAFPARSVWHSIIIERGA